MFLIVESFANRPESAARDVNPETTRIDHGTELELRSADELLRIHSRLQLAGSLEDIGRCILSVTRICGYIFNNLHILLFSLMPDSSWEPV
jgi:hypothetical protein